MPRNLLYDNAQLVSLYSRAGQHTKNPLYRETVYETLEFIEREMTSPEGGFYSSLDADSEGEEGKFYVWTKEEIEKELGVDADLFIDYYNVSKSGNWEHGKNILFRKQGDDEFAKGHNIKVEDLKKIISDSKSALLNARSNRKRPGLDDKILTSWNALMLKGYVHAYRAFGEERFLKAALRNVEFLLVNAISFEDGVTRNYKNGKSSIPGFLDDYAFVISAFIEIYQATFDEKWLQKANELTSYTSEHFFDATSGMFFYTHNEHSNLISRKKEITDNVVPASNSEMAKNLFLLGQYFYNKDFIEKSSQMLANIRKDVHQNIYFYSNWGIVELFFAAPFYEVAIIGKKAADFRSEIAKHYQPNALLLGSNQNESLELLKGKYIDGQTTIYVCRDKTCNLPVTSTAKALEQINFEG